MTRFLALAALLAVPAFAQVTVESDPTFDVTAKDPAVEAELTEKERELADFFDEDDPDVDPTVTYTPDADARAEKLLLERSEREFGEFDDIDDDDLAELSDARTEQGQPRLEKPGQLEKDFALDCPASTTEGVDGSCVAGPDFRFD